MMTNPHDAFSGQLRSPNMVSFYSFDMLRMVFCCSNFVRIRRTVFFLDIHLREIPWPRNRGYVLWVTEGHWKWYCL